MNKILVEAGSVIVELVVGDDGYMYSAVIKDVDSTIDMEFWGFNKTVSITDPENDSSFVEGLKGVLNMFQ